MMRGFVLCRFLNNNNNNKLLTVLDNNICSGGIFVLQSDVRGSSNIFFHNSIGSTVI